MSLSVVHSEAPSEIFYPAGDGEPVAETPIHFHALVLLVQAIQDFLAARLDVYIGANMFWYFEEGKPKSRRAPDIMVIKGVGRAPRRSFFSWREGNAVPCFILELASAKTFGEDLTKKRAVYAGLGVREYFMFDPEGAYLKEKLLGFRRDDQGEYQPMDPDEHGRLYSSELGLLLLAEGEIVRVFDAVSGVEVLSRAERADEQMRRANLLEQELAELKALLKLKNTGTSDAANES